MEIHDLFNESVLEEDVNQYIKRCYEILAAQSKLIENELGEVARVKFLDRIGISAGFFPKAVGNKIYNQLLLELIGLRAIWRNLLSLKPINKPL
jgi:hypothetical protein